MKGIAFLQLILGSTIEKDHQNCTKEEGNMGLTNKKRSRIEALYVYDSERI